MLCPNCSTELEGASTCPQCGSQVESDPTVAFVPLPDQNHPAITAEEAASVEGIAGYALVIERGPQAGMTYVLPMGAVTVGRHPNSSIFLDDVTVSRHHCRFSVTTDSLEVEDSGSTNGTYVNGSRVDRSRLEPGDEVLIGRFHLLVAHGDA
jgi:hypothetical protein